MNWLELASRMSFRGRLVSMLACSVLTWATTTARAQTYGYVQNRTGNTFLFSYGGQEIKMADPTCLPLTINGQTWFFVTGTSDDHNTSNFPIFKSRDLQHWCFHGTAFNSPGYNSAFPTSPPDHIDISGRRFKRLWSPQLWVNPNGLDPNIHMTFTCQELTTSDVVRIELSVMVSSMSLSQFQAGGSFFDAPIWYYYTPDGATTVADGGVSRGSSWVIPSTIGPYYVGTAPGAARQLLEGFEHIGRENQRTNPADGSFVFYDPRAANGTRFWLLYNTYQLKQGTGSGPFCLATTDYDGANCAAYPLYAHYLCNALDWSPVQKPVELFHRFNMTAAARPPAVYCSTTGTWIQNQYVGGPYGWYAVPSGNIAFEPSNYCAPQWMFYKYIGGQYYFPAWAEGPCALYWNNRYYVFATRNMYWGPAYVMTYRSVAATGSTLFKDTGLATPNDRNVAENVLVASNWYRDYLGNRNPSETRSFGDGEVFMAFGQPYLVFHARLETALSPPPQVQRRIFFKELTLSGDGVNFRRLYDGSTDAVEDLNRFWTRTDISSCP